MLQAGDSSVFTQLITEGHIWIDALEKRNLMAHTYDEGVAKEAEQLIKQKYYPVIIVLSYLFMDLKKIQNTYVLD